jgi:asparagine synthase (glutamine-hydrolysing)
MAAAIVHRGPDEEGFYVSDGVHLANRRLSILGLENGRQPLSNESGTVWVVFNGELYDYPHLRPLLESKGHQFHTQTDTELLPHLWEEYGIEMLERVRGQFAFCLYDTQRREVLLARDRAGICPLFYTFVRHDGTDWLLFASEIKALLASGLVERRPDWQGLNHIFTFFAMPGPTTVFAGVRCLLPGRYLHLRLNSELTPSTADRQHIFWQVNYPPRGQEVRDFHNQRVVDQFEAVLLQAVQRRLQHADVPVVAYLSGGVDSSIIVALANHVLGRPLPTFTVAVQAAGLNEMTEALQTAEHLGCEPVVVDCGHDQLRVGYPELIAAAEFPVIDTSCLGLMHLARAVHEHGYKVVLTGEGADEWLAGYPWFKIHRLTGWLDRIPGVPLGYVLRSAMLWLRGYPRFSYHIYRQTQEQMGGPNGWFDLYGIMSLNKLRFFAGAAREYILQHSALEDLDLPPELPRWHRFHRQMYFGARIMLPGHLLASKGDRIAMHSSVEGRYAFLDEDVITFMAQLHPRWKLRGLLQDKYVERLVAQRWLPPQIAWRRKHMFRAPMDSWAKMGAQNWIDQVLSPAAINRVGLFDVKAVVEARRQLQQPGRGWLRTSLEMGLTAVTATQLWHHLYISGDLCDLPHCLHGSTRAVQEWVKQQGGRPQCQRPRRQHLSAVVPSTIA